jgi:hypothetical protein
MERIEPSDIKNVVELAKKVINDGNLAELHNSILYDKKFDIFRRVYDDDYIDIIYFIIIEYGENVHVQEGGIIPIIAGIIVKKVAKKGIKKKLKKSKKEKTPKKKSKKKTPKKKSKKKSKKSSEKGKKRASRAEEIYDESSDMLEEDE